MRWSVLLAVLLLGVVPCGAEVDFSKPGQFPVGVTTLPLQKLEIPGGGPRLLPTMVWYPAVRGTGTKETLGLRDAKVRRGKYPLMIYSHGTCGRPTESTYLANAMASRGFIVAAMPHPGQTGDDFPDCLFTDALIQAIRNRVPDVSFTIDSMLAENDDPSSRFRKRLKPDTLIMSGGSFGGFTTLLAEQQEPRVKTALVLVPGGTAALAPETISLPTMVIGSERDTVVTYAESEKAYAHLSGPKYLVELLGGNHLSAFDSCFNDELNRDVCVKEDISQETAHQLILRYAVPFLLRYGKGVKSAGKALRSQVDGVVYQHEEP